MSKEPTEFAFNIPLAHQTYNRVDALRYLTGHPSVPAMALRLVEITLLEEEREVAVPSHPGRLPALQERVFVRPPARVTTALVESADAHKIAPLRLAMYVVEQALLEAAEVMPELDAIDAIRSRHLFNRRNAVYLPA